MIDSLVKTMKGYTVKIDGFESSGQINFFLVFHDVNSAMVFSVRMLYEAARQRVPLDLSLGMSVTGEMWPDPDDDCRMDYKGERIATAARALSFAKTGQIWAVGKSNTRRRRRGRGVFPIVDSEICYCCFFFWGGGGGKGGTTREYGHIGSVGENILCLRVSVRS